MGKDRNGMRVNRALLPLLAVLAVGVACKRDDPERGLEGQWKAGGLHLGGKVIDLSTTASLRDGLSDFFLSLPVPVPFAKPLLENIAPIGRTIRMLTLHLKRDHQLEVLAPFVPRITGSWSGTATTVTLRLAEGSFPKEFDEQGKSLLSEGFTLQREGGKLVYRPDVAGFFRGLAEKMSRPIPGETEEGRAEREQQAEQVRRISGVLSLVPISIVLQRVE